MPTASYRISWRLLTVLTALCVCGGLRTGSFAAERGVSVAAIAPDANQTWGTYHALVIGIDDYAYWPRLRTAVNDAKVIHQVLIDKYGFKPENTVLRLDEDASRENIIRDIRRIAVAMKKNDNLLIYYAGHGQIDDVTGDGYWIPAEGAMKETWTWVPNSLIKSLLGSDRIRAKNVMIIADSCYSGAMLRGGPSLLALTDKGYKEKLLLAAAKRSRQVISSGGVEPVADGGADGHSLFAYYLIKALRENDREVIDLENLFHTNVWKPVTQIGNQRPNVGRLKSPMDDDGQFVLLNQAWMETQRRNALAAEKRRREAERRTLEKQLQQEAQQRAALELEKERLALEREKLELEKIRVSQKQRLEREQLELERQKQELEQQKQNQPMMAVRSRSDASRIGSLPSAEATIALFPLRMHKKFGSGKARQLLLALTDAVDNIRQIRLSHSFDLMQAHSSAVDYLDLSSEDKPLWVKPSFFSSPQPDLSRVVKIGKKLGFDFACFIAATTSIDFQGNDIHIFIIDVANSKLYEKNERAVYYQTVRSEVTKICEKLLKQALTAHSR